MIIVHQVLWVQGLFEVLFYAFNPKDIFNMAFEWNTDRIRLSKNSSVPSGHPDELYSLPGKLGYVLDNSGTSLYKGQIWLTQTSVLPLTHWGQVPNPCRLLISLRRSKMYQECCFQGFI